MKLEEIQQHWERDACIDRTELGEESLRIPQLHSKYYQMYSAERSQMRQLEYKMINLKRAKYEWYAGTISEEELKERNWEPNPLKILRSDIPMYLESDDDIVNLNVRLEFQRDKVDFIESIIKSLPARGYQIKSAIDWEKFKVGA